MTETERRMVEGVLRSFCCEAKTAIKYAELLLGRALTDDEKRDLLGYR